MNIFNYIKIIGVFALAIIGFMFGESKAENKANEEKLRQKEEEEKDDKELQERIIKYDNVPNTVKRNWMRTRAKAKNK